MSTSNNKSNNQKSGRDAIADDVAKSTNRVIAAGNKVVHDASKSSDQTARRVAEATGDTIKHNVEATEQNLHKATEKATGNVVDAARKMSGQAHEQLDQLSALQEKATQKVADRAQQSSEAMIQSGFDLTGSYQSIMQEWAGYTRSAIQCNIDGFNRIMQVRSPKDFVAAQSDLLNAHMQVLLESNVKILEAGLRVAGDAAQRIQSAQGE